METPKMVVFVVKLYAVREAKKWRYAVRKAKIGRYAVCNGGGEVIFKEDSRSKYSSILNYIKSVVTHPSCCHKT